MSKAHAHSHHITPIPKLAGNLIALMVLMVATIAWYYVFANGIIAHSWWSSWLNNIGMLGIAMVKAYLVIQIFMGVKWSSNLIKSYVILGFVWFTMLFLVFCDYGTRFWEPVQGWSKDGTLALPRTSEPNERGLPTRKEMEKQTEAAHGGGH